MKTTAGLTLPVRKFRITVKFNAYIEAVARSPKHVRRIGCLGKSI